MRRNILVTVLLLAMLLLAWDTSAALPSLQVGFDGHFKTESWFPVTLDPIPGAESVSLQMLASGYGMGGPESTVVGVFRAEQDLVTGAWHALVYASRSHFGHTLQAVITLDDGQERVIESSIQGIDPGTTLLLVVTDRPEAFSFLRALEHGDRRITVVVAQDARLLHQRDWRDFSGIDAIVLDGPEPLSDDDRQAVRDWTLQGGSVILTDRVWEEDDAVWGLAPIREMPERVVADGAGLEAFVRPRESIASFRRMPTRLDGFVSVYEDAVGTLIGVLDLGRGRVVALGFDWASLELRDRALQESVRRDIWNGALSLVREPSDTPHIRSNLAIPREAQLKHLVWPILVFLVICGLILGPLNWFVLRRMQRSEYTVLTLPAGALALSAAALLAGMVWRPNHVIVEELYVSLDAGDTSCWTYGVSGVFSPREDVYDASVMRPAVLVRDAHLHTWRSWGGMAIASDLVYRLGRRASGVEGLDIGRWSMRFLQSAEVEARPLGLEGRAHVVDMERIAGTVINAGDDILEHVNVVFQQFRVSLGTLAPGEERSFTLDLRESEIAKGKRCSGCGGFHHSNDPFMVREGEDALPPQMEALGNAVVRWTREGLSVPVVVAMQPVRDSFVHVSLHGEGARGTVLHDGNPGHVAYRGTRVVGSPVAMAWDVSGYMPDGFAYLIGLQRAQPGMDTDLHDAAWQRNIRRAPAQYLPAVVALRNAFRDTPALQGGVDADGVAMPANIPMRSEGYILPAAMRGRVMIDWHFEESNEEQPGLEHDAILEVYHWESDAWHELARATFGEHQVLFDTDAGYMMDGYPVVVLRQRVLSDALAQQETMMLHSHGVRFPSLQQLSISFSIVPEGEPDA